MPLTLPADYASGLHQKNIAENWLLDLYSDVDSGYTLDEIVSLDETSSIQLNPRISGTNSEKNTAIQADLPVGQNIRIGDELMTITASQHISTSLINVTRSVGGTVQRSHPDDSKIFTVTNLSLAFRDQTVESVQYYGAIKNRPSIRTNINLDKMTSGTGNVSVELINLDYKGARLSAELINGTRTYLNRPARIISAINNNNDIDDGLVLFTGKLTRISLSSDGSTINLELETDEPWNRITFPQDKTVMDNVYIPLAYGAFASNDDQLKQREANKKMHPVPILRVGEPEVLIVMPPQSYSAIRPHHYEDSFDGFVQLYTDSYQQATEDNNSAYDANSNIGLIKTKFRRRFGVNPISLADTNATVDGWTNAKNLLLHSYNASGAGFDYSSGNVEHNVYYNFPTVQGKSNDTKAIAKGTIQTATNNGSATQIDWRLIAKRSSGTLDSGDYRSIAIGSGTGTITLGQDESGGGGSDLRSSVYGEGYQDMDLDTFLSNNNHQLPSIQIQTEWATNASTLASTITMTDLQLYYDVELEYADRTTSVASYNFLNQIEHMYCGSNGLPETYSGSSAVAQHGHEVHRDLLTRFADLPTHTPTGWDTSFHDSSESGGGVHDKRHVDAYGIRYWQLEPVSLKDKLDQLAYEFNFIFKYRPDRTTAYIMPGSGNGSNSAYQAGDVAATITGDDIEKNSFAFSHTNMSDIMTKMVINNELHPARSGTYVTSTTCTNSTTREKYAFRDKENINEINLDMNVGTPATTPAADHNTDWYSFMDHLHGEIKDVVKCTIINPAIGYKLETGDVVLFSDMPINPGGGSWTSKYFMITDHQRTNGAVTITAREVSA